MTIMSEAFKKMRNKGLPDQPGKKGIARPGETVVNTMIGQPVISKYFPRNKDDPSISIDGFIIPAAGYPVRGKDPVLDEWVKRGVLRVSLLTPEQAGLGGTPQPKSPEVAPAPVAPTQPPPAIVTEVAQPPVQLAKQETVPVMPDGEPQTFANAPALHGGDGEASQVDEADIGDVDEVHVPLESAVREQYPKIANLRAFSKKFDLTDRGYDALMVKLIAGGHVQAEEEFDGQSSV